MTGVSSLELTIAAVDAGIAASFPVHNCATSAEVDRWLGRIAEGTDPAAGGAVLPNLVVHKTNARLPADLAVLTRRRVPAVITSVGSPAQVVGPLQDAGVLVLSDVSSLHHAERALALGVDGLVLLSAGAGGQTGWANPLAFTRAVRAMWDGPLILSGGVVDGVSLPAARVAGCDLGYMGTRFIATAESAVSDGYRAAVVAARLDDIETTSALTGLATNIIRPARGLPRTAVDEYDTALLPDLDSAAGNADAYSAGHSVSAVTGVSAASTLIAQIESEYRATTQLLSREREAISRPR